MSFQVISGILNLDFSVPRLSSIALAALCDRTLSLLLRYISQSQMYRQLYEFGRQFGSCRFKRHLPSALISPNSLERLKGKTWSRVSQLDDHIAIASFDEFSETRLCPDLRPIADVAFCGPVQSFIFLVSDPKKGDSKQKFRVLHEIGHAADASIFVLRKNRFLSLFFLPLGAWLVFQFGASAPDYVLWIYAAVLSVLALSAYPRQVITDTHLEQLADHFALTCLPHSDRINFVNYMLPRFPRSWPVDKKHQILNAERISDLKEKLQLIHTHPDEDLSFTFPSPKYNWMWWFGPVFFAFLALFTTPMDWGTIALLLMYLVLFGLVTAGFAVRSEWHKRRAQRLRMMQWLKAEAE